jgi:hypothetical protein
MAVISTIASMSAGCGGESINTGDLGCDIEFGLVIHALGFRKGIVIPAATDITQDYIDTLVQSGDVIPMMDAFSSEPTIADDTLETSPLGVEALTLKGLPKYMLTMKKGENYYKEMAKLTGFGNLNWVLGDVNGNWKFAINTDGAFTGFTAGQTLAAITTPATATETEKKSVTFQLTDRVQIDVSYAVVLSAKLFPISNVTGINGTLLSFADANGAVPPAVADTTLKVKALLAADKHTGIEGLSVSDFKYTVDGVSETPSGVVDNGNGDYTLTVVALAASTIVLSLWDSAVSKNVVIVSSELYRSNSLTDVIS